MVVGTWKLAKYQQEMPDCRITVRLLGWLQRKRDVVRYVVQRCQRFCMMQSSIEANSKVLSIHMQCVI